MNVGLAVLPPGKNNLDDNVDAWCRNNRTTVRGGSNVKGIACSRVHAGGEF